MQSEWGMARCERPASSPHILSRHLGNNRGEAFTWVIGQKLEDTSLPEEPDRQRRSSFLRHFHG
jgi:hypothetical protein